MKKNKQKSDREKFYLTMSNKFPKEFNKENKETGFRESVLKTLNGESGNKIHFLRDDYFEWRYIKKQLDQDKCDLYVMELNFSHPKPKLNLVRKIAHIEVQQIDASKDDVFIIDGKEFSDIELFAKNEGLSLENFQTWRELRKGKDCSRGAIVHLTDFKYK